MTKRRYPDVIDVVLYVIVFGFLLVMVWGYPVHSQEHAALDANGNITWPIR